MFLNNILTKLIKMRTNRKHNNLTKKKGFEKIAIFLL